MAAHAHVENFTGDAERTFVEALRKTSTCSMRGLLLPSDRRAGEASGQTTVFILSDCTVMKHSNRYLIVASTSKKLRIILTRFKLWNCTITRLVSKR